MKRRHFLASVSLLAVASCSRDGVRYARYDEHECPFCTTKKGTCTYCSGTKECSFCKGTGRRKVVADDRSNDKITKTVYEEACPFCDGKGVCWYCGGKGSCRSCDGTGRIDSWDFYAKEGKIDSGNGRGLK
jgi:RecJ-like exonuclease